MKSLVGSEENTSDTRGKKKRRSRYERQPEKADNIRLTMRDMGLFYYLYAYRYLDANQIYKLLGVKGQSREAKYRNRLGRLFHGGYIHRKQNPREIEPGTGSVPIIYALWNGGAKEIIEYLQSKDFNIPPARSDWKQRNKANLYRLDHRLMTSEFMVNMILTADATDGLEFIDQLNIMKDRMTPYHRQAEGERLWWDVEYEVEGKLESKKLEPDQMFALARTIDGQQYFRYFFLEVDRGTETQLTTIRGKMKRYRISARERLLHAHYGIETFNVLIVTTGKEKGRMQNMMEASRAATDGKGWQPFLFTTEGQINDTLRSGKTLLEALWLNGRGECVTLRQVLYG